MYRKAIEDLQAWKEKEEKKPLILQGARQVGKTWLLKEFGRTSYSQYLYVNFDNNQVMKTLFDGDMRLDRIIAGLELYAGYRIDPAQTLLIFDEIQEVPQALHGLKYFCEEAPEYQIVCAGSLLGVALHGGTSFPVGKVEFLHLQPLSFYEFLMAMGKDRHVDLLVKGDFTLASVLAVEYEFLLKQYYFLGGMPEVVAHFVEHKDFFAARQLQKQILLAYEQDFSKHAPPEVVPKIRMLWDSFPAQLARENRKFMYGIIKQGARAKDYEMAMLWLFDCGLIHKVHRVSAPRLPAKGYADIRAFKMFLVDIGLLGCMAGLSEKVLIHGDELFTQFKGALTEQFVLQQIQTLDASGIYYWSNSKGSAELDFLLDTGDTLIPLEVKAERNLKSKSLKVYLDKFSPPVAIRSSLAGYEKSVNTAGTLIDLPLWAIAEVFSCIEGGLEV